MRKEAREIIEKADKLAAQEAQDKAFPNTTAALKEMSLKLAKATPNRNARVYFQFDDDKPRKFYDLIEGNDFKLDIINPADHLAGDNEDPLDPPARTIIFRSQDGKKSFRLFVEVLKEGEE